MKILNKFTVLILSITILFTSALFGCNKNTNQTETEKPLFESTGNYIFKNGLSDYKIVLPSNASSDEIVAGEEIKFLLSESTNVELQTIYDTDIQSIDEQSKYILIGDNKFAVENNIVPTSAQVNLSGYVIKTVDNCVYIVGPSGTATLFGAYKFLEYTVNYDYFYTDIYHVDENVLDIPLMKYDLVFKSPFDFSVIRYGAFNDSHSQHTKYSTYRRPFDYDPNTGFGGHSSMNYLPMSKFANENDPDNYHPDWYMDEYNGVVNQLCYTAHGNPTEYELMIKTAAQTIFTAMENNPNLYLFDFSLTDASVDDYWCYCDTCTELAEHYDGAWSGSVVIFLNDLTDYINEYFQTDEGKAIKREYYIFFYCYFNLINAPVKYNEGTGEVTLIDDKVICNKEVVPEIGDLGMDYTQSIYAEINKDTYKRYVTWEYLSTNMAAYIYSAVYNDYLVPFDNFNDLQELYQFLEKVGTMSVFNLGNGAEKGFHTGWSALRAYLVSKLSQDVDIDMNYYIQKFFDNIYLEGSEKMKQLFDEFRFVGEYNTATFPDYSGKSVCYNDFTKEDFFSKQLLLRWRNLCNEALAEVQENQYKDLSAYRNAYNMICGERVWVNYLFFIIYGNDSSIAEQTHKDVKNELLSDIERLGITTRQEGPKVSIDGLVDLLKR